MRPVLAVMAAAGVLVGTGVADARHNPGHGNAGPKFQQHGLFAGAPSIRTDGRRASANPAHNVYVNGYYAGSDPDPFVRSMLRRDPRVPYAY